MQKDISLTYLINLLREYGLDYAYNEYFIHCFLNKWWYKLGIGLRIISKKRNIKHEKKCILSFISTSDYVPRELKNKLKSAST